MPDFAFIDYSTADGLATIALARGPHNILHVAMLDELDRALDLAGRDASVRLLVLTGAGEKAFSAGVDVADHVPARVAGMLSAFHGVVRRLVDFPVPTVAALNGAALGGGCELALACDMRVASEQARLGLPEIRLGVFPPVAAVLLPRLMAVPRAMEMMLGGAPVDAQEALALGLLNRVFPAASFAAEVQTFVAPFLGLSRAALVQTRRAIREAAGKSFDEALTAVERRYLDELMTTADAAEGLAAFLEKRPPVWRHE